MRRRATWQRTTGLAVLALLACARDPQRGPPSASFLVVAGDSTFWAEVRRGTSTLRSAPMLLAELDGRFHELYVTDDDRSFYDAVIVGQRVYRRDLISGDSMLMFEDSTVGRIAAEYAAAHPGERPLSEDEPESDDPATVATTETEIVDVVGPFATVLRHVDMDLESGEEAHATRQLVLDLRSGRAVSLSDVLPDSAAGRVEREGRRRFDAVRDSIRRDAPPDAEITVEMLPHFAFERSSFSVVVDEGGPAIAFLAPGTGPEAGESALPLSPIAIPADSWWRAVAPTLPVESTDDTDVWEGADARYRIEVQYDTVAGGATLAVRDSAGELWPLGSLPLPVLRVHRLDREDADRRMPKALLRAFEEAARYSRDTKTAVLPTGLRAWRLVARPLPLRARD